MSLAGYLSEYSLAEIFHFVQEGNKTGLLVIEPEHGLNRSLNDAYYLSFQCGRIAAVAKDSGSPQRGLLKMIEQRRWLPPAQIAGTETQLNLLQQPLGTYLKSRNALNSEQLTLLFNSQVIAPTCKLFEVDRGQFKFHPQAATPYAEMTGLSVTAHEAALLGLRMLKDWSSLTAKLPDPQSALQRFSTELSGLRLDTQEMKVWKLSLCEMSIAKIAAQLGLEIAKVQQIGFRLSVIGVVQEISADPLQPPIDKMMEVPKPICVGGGNPHAPLSVSFLSNLMGFLKKKG